MPNATMKLFRVPILLAVLLLVACVSNTPAPVETRTTGSAPIVPTASAVPAAPAVARPGYYLVKKGDTLYSIAMEHGQSFRDVASWNSLDNPNVIQIGQELRVAPPDAASAPAVTLGTTQAVVPARIEVRPADQTAPAVKQDDAVVTEPRGGRIAYTTQAWRDLQGLASAPAAASAPTAASAPADAKPAIKPADPTPPKTNDAKANDAADWQWPSNGKVIATFNDSTSKGVDLAGAIGDPVVAASAGQVIYAGSHLRGYGNLVIIKHSSQFTTVYAHNKELLVKEGQTVQKGQKIAVMGDSDAERPKLHFELRKPGGQPVDPLKYLPTR